MASGSLETPRKGSPGRMTRTSSRAQASARAGTQAAERMAVFWDLPAQQEVLRKTAEAHPHERCREQLAGAGQRDGAPDAAERVETPAGIPGVQPREDQHDAEHREVGELEAHARDDARREGQLDGQRGAEDLQRPPPAPRHQPGQFVQQDEQEGPHQRGRDARHHDISGRESHLDGAACQHGAPAPSHPAQGAVQDSVEDTQVQPGQGQDVRSAGGAEGRDRLPIQPVALPGEQGLQQRGGAPVGELGAVNGAQQPFCRPPGPRPGCRPQGDGQDGGTVAEDAQAQEKQGEKEGDPAPPGAGDKQGRRHETAARGGPIWRTSPGRQTCRQCHSC